MSVPVGHAGEIDRHGREYVAMIKIHWVTIQKGSLILGGDERQTNELEEQFNAIKGRIINVFYLGSGYYQVIYDDLEKTN